MSLSSTHSGCRHIDGGMAHIEGSERFRRSGNAVSEHECGEEDGRDAKDMDENVRLVCVIRRLARDRSEMCERPVWGDETAKVAALT